MQPIEILGAVVSAIAPPPSDMTWVDAATLVRNSGFDSSVAMSQGGYGRLPESAQNGTWCSGDPCPVRDKVWNIGRNGAGLYLEFQSNSSEIWLNASLISAPKEYANCGYVCGSGFDMYAYDVKTSAWRWVSTTTNQGYGGGWNYTSAHILRMMTDDSELVARGDGTAYYRIHLPIYNGIVSAQIGVKGPANIILPTEASSALPPIAWYGTSIVNGHVASRPGMIFTTVLGRMLNRSVINLGFGGNGEMERSVVKVVSQLKQAGLVVIDCNWNMDPDHIRHNATSVVAQLRLEWSATKPIVLAEGTSAGAAWITPQVHQMQAARRAALAAAYAELIAAGAASNVHYIKGDDIIGKSGDVDIPTAMGTHPTDLGHNIIANYYARVLPPILAGVLPTHPALPPPSLPSAGVDDVQQDEDQQQQEEQQHDDANACTVPSMSYGCTTDCPIAWTDARTLSVGGRAEWDGLPRENWYDRFPLAAKENVTSEHRSIWGLSKCTPGEFVEFKIEGGNVSSIWVNYSVYDAYGTNPSGGRLPIMPWVGRRGVDLYGQSVDSGEWVWAGNQGGQDPTDDQVCGAVVGTNQAWYAGSPTDNGMNTSAATRFILYLPLWRACSGLSIGIPAVEAAAGAKLVAESGGIDRTKAPIVWYGTSIVHGAASTRAGDSFTNRISRGINRTVLNFGFSGSGHMDLGIGMWLLKIDAAAYIIDCNWNMQPAEIAAKTGPIVHQIRAARPGIPIILAEGTPNGDSWVSPSKQDDNNAALRAAYAKLIEDKVTDLHYVTSADLYSTTGPLVNPTVGGCHPSDLGAHDVAQFYVKFWQSLLAD